MLSAAMHARSYNARSSGSFADQLLYKATQLAIRLSLPGALGGGDPTDTWVH